MIKIKIVIRKKKAIQNKFYDINIWERMIERRADINAKSYNGDGLLHNLFQNSKSFIGIISLLLESGINVNHKNKKGETS